MTNTITKSTTRTASAAGALPTATKKVVQNYFNRKIGNTTFVVSVSFNEKATESMDDKILRLVASDIQGAGRSPDGELLAYATEEAQQCS